MPCRDYDYRDDFATTVRDAAREAEHKQQRDKLARIACKALTELERNGIADLLLIKDDEVREWWTAHKEADRKAAEERAEKARRAKIKRNALKKLNDEEKELLGIK